MDESKRQKKYIRITLAKETEDVREAVDVLASFDQAMSTAKEKGWNLHTFAVDDYS